MNAVNLRLLLKLAMKILLSPDRPSAATGLFPQIGAEEFVDYKFILICTSKLPFSYKN